MAKKAKARGGARGAGSKAPAARTSSKAAKRVPARTASKPRPASELTAKEAIVGILESPLVAEVIAAGAAAALSTITQQALSKRGGGTAKALKDAALAAGAAMGARLALEADEIMKVAKGEVRPGAK